MGTDVWRPIRAELRRVLLGVAGVNNDRIAYEGRIFDPNVVTPPAAWIEERIVKGRTDTATLGSQGMVRENGIYVLDLNWPRRASFADGEDLADAIRVAYWHGRSVVGLGADPAAGNVVYSNQQSTIMFDNWTQFPVRIGFFFYRNTIQVPA